MPPDRRPASSVRRPGLITTFIHGEGSKPAYALEGSIFIAAAVQWLRNGLGLVRTAAETEKIARSVPDTGWVYLVPAFVGLGAPHWDMAARVASRKDPKSA